MPGGLGGPVVSRSRIPKPKAQGENLQGAGKYLGVDFYTLDDFYIGQLFICANYLFTIYFTF